MRVAMMLLASLLAVSAAMDARAQSGGNRAGFSSGGFSGRSGGYQPGFGNYGYLGGGVPQPGLGGDGYGQGAVGSARGNAAGGLGDDAATGYGQSGSVFTGGGYNGGGYNGGGYNGGGYSDGDGGRAADELGDRGDDGVRFGGAGSTDLGHGVHLGNGSVGNLPNGAGGETSGGFVSPAYGNEQWHPNYFPGD